MNAIQCILYFAILGVSSLFIGRLFPKRWFRHDNFPYQSLPIEQNGRIYERIGIKRWKDKVPDMSKLLPNMIAQKQLSLGVTSQHIELLIQETCIAEFLHILLCVAGFGCVFLWPGMGGVIVSILYALIGNLPFILIQRYNRPRLVQIVRRMNPHATTASKQENTYERTDFKLQYWTRS